MGRYEMRDEGGAREVIECNTIEEALEEAQEWAEGGEWGDTGATVTVMVRNLETDDTDSVTVEIPPVEPECDDSYEHDLRPSPTDGCSENPGVWSLGGTTICTVTYCLHCGRRRTETDRGNAHQPYEGPRVTVEWSDEPEANEMIAALREYYGVEVAE